MGELAQWQCHKIVRAGKILQLPVIEADAAIAIYVIEDVNGAPAKVAAPADIVARKPPSLGDYIVIYADGYTSWSPAAAFEEGYARLTPKA